MKSQFLFAALVFAMCWGVAVQAKVDASLLTREYSSVRILRTHGVCVELTHFRDPSKPKYLACFSA